MSDENELNESTGWVRLYHPSGALVTLPVPIDTRVVVCYRTAFDAVSSAIASGFTSTAPGLDAGEQKEEVGYVLRRSKSNQDKSETPIIDLYITNDAVKFK